MSASLHKFTTEFIPEEGRLRLSCELVDGQHVVLWLTQRLLRRLLPHLCNWLEKQPVPVAVPASPQALVVERAQVHQMAQQLAQTSLTLQKQLPVQAPPATLSGVVQTASLQSKNGQLHLTMQTGEAADYGVSFAPTALRQWLGILHKHYQAAQWPMELWPEWIASTRASHRQASAAALLH